MALINASLFFCMRVSARKFEFIVILSSSISLLRERISFLQQSQQLLLAGGDSGVLDRDISSLIIILSSTLIESFVSSLISCTSSGLLTTLDSVSSVDVVSLGIFS